MAADVTATSIFETSVPKRLFTAANIHDWDVTADGKRFLAAVYGNTPITLMLNWQTQLKK